MIRNAGLLKRGGVVDHAVDYETVKAIAGERISDAQRFQHEQRLAQSFGMLERAIERKIVVRAPRRDHPIQHVLAAAAQLGAIDSAHAKTGNGSLGHRSSSCHDFPKRADSV